MTSTSALMYFRNAMNHHSMLSGTVTGVFKDEDVSAQSYMTVRPKQYADEIPALYMSFYEAERFGIFDESLFLGSVVNFYPTLVDDDGYVEISRRQVQEENRQRILNILQRGETVNARVSFVKKSEAILWYKGVKFILRSKDFSDDYTAVDSVLSAGDRIDVCLSEVSRSQGIIFVRLPVLYHSPADPREASLEKGQIWDGTVVEVKGHITFVRILNCIDILCGSSRKIHEGDEVKVKISQIKEDGEGKKRIRGVMVLEKPMHAGLVPQKMTAPMDMVPVFQTNREKI